MVRHLAAGGGHGALVAFGRRMPRSAAAQLRRGRGRVAATLIALPRTLPPGGPTEVAAGAALHALSHAMGRMALARTGRRLSAFTEAGKHRGILLGAGVLAAAGAALWFNRGKIGRAARPGLARMTHPIALQAMRWRSRQAPDSAAGPPQQVAWASRFRR
jgi:hypothetical protein